MRKFRSLSLAAAALVAASLVSLPGTADAATRCSDTTPPSWFYTRLTNAANDDPNIPDSWGTSYNMARIACFESTYEVHAQNGSYYGLTQMSQSLIASENVSWDHYWNGSTTHHIGYYQLLAAMRYCKARYGTPANAWDHEVNYGWW